MPSWFSSWYLEHLLPSQTIVVPHGSQGQTHTKVIQSALWMLDLMLFKAVQPNSYPTKIWLRGSAHRLETSGSHEPLARYEKLRVGRALGMPGTFSHYYGLAILTCVTYVPWCMLGSLTSGFLWRRWWGKRSWHSRPMRNSQFCVSGKKPMEQGIPKGIKGRVHSLVGAENTGKPKALARTVQTENKVRAEGLA